MRSQPRTPRRMIPMHVVQGLDFVVAKRGNILHGECSHLSRSSRFMLSLPCKLFTLASRVSGGMRISYETLCPSTYFPETTVSRDGEFLICEIQEHLYTKYWEHKFSAYAFAEAMERAVRRLVHEGHPFANPTRDDEDVHIFVRWQLKLSRWT